MDMYKNINKQIASECELSQICSLPSDKCRTCTHFKDKNKIKFNKKDIHDINMQIIKACELPFDTALNVITWVCISGIIIALVGLTSAIIN